MARRAERRRLAGLAQQGDGDSAAEEVAAETQGASGVAWTGCQWLMEGYCGRAEEAAAMPRRTDARQEEQGGDVDRCQGDEQMNDNDPPHRPNQAA